MNKKYFKGIVLSSLLLFSANAMHGETISGVVKDKSGVPINGAKVVLLGDYKQQAVTNANGEFVIEASLGDYLKIETPDNSYQLDKIEQEEMVVFIDKGSRLVSLETNVKVRSDENTAAVSRITAAELSRSSAMDPSNALYGLGTGLTVLQNSGDPWSNSASLYVRGIGSLYSYSPMILVDGFERPLNMVSKEEIESIEILKDAAATALYGLKGANGVISVITKKGKYESRNVSVSYDQAFNKQMRLPEFVNAQDYAKGINEAMANDYQTIRRYNDYEVDAFGSGASPYYANVNWVKEMLRNTGSSSMFNVNFSGGNKNARYFSLLNLNTNNGFVKPENITPQFSSQLKFSQFNIRTNLDIDLTSTTLMSVRLMGTIQSMNMPHYTGSGIMNLIYNTPSAAFPIFTSSGKYGASSTWTANPIAEVTARGFSQVNTRTLLADLALTQNLDALLKGLSVSGRIALDTYAAYNEGQNQDYASEINTVQFDASGNPSTVIVTPVGKNTTPSRYKNLGSQWRTYNFEGQANYENIFDKSLVKASLILSSNQAANTGQNNTYNRLRIATHVHYGYDNKYFVDGIFTVHGSNLLPEHNRFGYFPSISAGWLLSNESFLNKSKIIDMLKVRASVGITGNDALPSGTYNLFNQYFGGKNGGIFGDGYSSYGGLGELRLKSDDLTYEKTYKYNIGVDGSFLNMFDVSVDVFLAKTRDILVNAQGSISGVLGMTPNYYSITDLLPYSNSGAVDNKGIEIGLNFHKTISGAKIFAGGNFSFARNKIIEMGEEYYPNEAAKQTGKSVGQAIGYKVLGLFQDDAEIASSPQQILYPVVVGDFKYADIYGTNGIVDTYDRTSLGYSTYLPEINFSFNFGGEYKGFGIDAMLQGVANYSANLLNNIQYIPLIGNGNLSQAYYDNRWTLDNKDAKYPRLTLNDNANNYVTNSTWIVDASFLKLRHCEVYYKIPKEWIKSLNLDAVKVYVRGMDLLTFDSLNDADPESFRTGNINPSVSSVHIGAKIEF